MLKPLISGLLLASLSLSEQADFTYRVPMGWNFRYYLHLR